MTLIMTLTRLAKLIKKRLNCRFLLLPSRIYRHITKMSPSSFFMGHAMARRCARKAAFTARLQADLGTVKNFSAPHLRRRRQRCTWLDGTGCAAPAAHASSSRHTCRREQYMLMKASCRAEERIHRSSGRDAPFTTASFLLFFLILLASALVDDGVCA